MINKHYYKRSNLFQVLRMCVHMYMCICHAIAQKSPYNNCNLRTQSLYPVLLDLYNYNKLKLNSATNCFISILQQCEVVLESTGYPCN